MIKLWRAMTRDWIYIAMGIYGPLLIIAANLLTLGLARQALEDAMQWADHKAH